MKYGLGYSVATKMVTWAGRNIAGYRAVELKEILKHAKENQKILDFGCNDAYITKLIKDKAPSSDVYGADINKPAIRYAKKKHKNIKFSVINKGFYKKNRNKFDFVLLSHVLEHVPDPEEVLEDIKRLLKPKGKLIVAVPQEIFRGEKTFPQLIYNLIRLRFENPHVRRISYDSCRKMLEEKGFNVLSFKYTKMFSDSAKKKKPLLAGSLIVVSELKG